MKRLMVSLTVTVLVAAGCGSSSSDEATSSLDRTQRSPLVQSDNGRSFNGRSFNGRSFNGRSFNGRSFNGRSFNGVAMDGVTAAGGPLARVTLDGTVFSGWYVSRTIRPTEIVPDRSLTRVIAPNEIVPDEIVPDEIVPDRAQADEIVPDRTTTLAARGLRPDLTGTGFTGVIFSAILDDGTRVPMRVDAVQHLPSPNEDLLGYSISFQTDDGWVSYCDLDGGLAVPMTGLWNYGENVAGAGTYDPAAAGFTFACRGYAIAKCVELGYRPWERGLASYTVACTRLLRADYCGTGVSYTVDGTLLDLYDRRGIQVSEDPTWPIEAEWNASGAVCMTPGVVDRFSLTGETPPCLSEKVTSRCDGSFGGADRTLLIDRYSAAR